MKIAIATAIIRSPGNIDDVINVGLLFAVDSRSDEELTKIIMSESESNISKVKANYDITDTNVTERFCVYTNIISCRDVKGMITALISILKVESGNSYNELPVELLEMINDFLNGKLPIDSKEE